MDNLLDSWIKTKGLTYAQAARALKCSGASIHCWISGKRIPSSAYAWKIHKMTKGEIPITYWGFEVRRNKIKRMRDE